MEELTQGYGAMRTLENSIRHSICVVKCEENCKRDRANDTPATNLRISDDDLTKLNRTSLPLADGKGDYWASMEVYHHLHCLVRIPSIFPRAPALRQTIKASQKAIRHYIAIDYYPEDTEAEMFIVKPGQVYPEHIGKVDLLILQAT